MEEQRSIPEEMSRLAIPDRQPSKRDLRGISDLSRSESAEFWERWQALPAVRRRELATAMQELAEENPELDFREAFLRCLDDDDLSVRAVAVHGLWEDDRVSTMRRLLRMLREDVAAEVRAAAATGLGRFAYEVALGDLDDDYGEQLFAALLAAFQRDDTVEVRRRVLETLGYYGEEEQVAEAIRAAYADANELWQQSALFAMGRSMSSRWLGQVREALGSRQAPLRYEAARASGEFGEQGQPLIPALIPLVEDGDLEVALAAIWALGEIGGGKARETLKRVARSSDEARRQAAEEALEELDMLDGAPLFGNLN